MPTIDEATSWRGLDAHGANGEKLGTISEIYLDQDTGQPEWAAIKTGLFGTRLSFAPLAEASRSGDGVRLPYRKDEVKDAPSVEADGALSQDEEAALYRHYGLNYSDKPSDSGLPTGGGTHAQDDRSSDPTPDGTPGVVGNDVSGPETDNAMTRSEEELRVGTTSREAGRARLKKHVVTEHVQTTVPVQREEVRIEREPITDANAGAAMDGPAISEEEHEVVLREEQPVVEKNVVPKERVRLDTDTVTEERQVSEDVRKEQIEMDGDRLRVPPGVLSRGIRCSAPPPFTPEPPCSVTRSRSWKRNTPAMSRSTTSRAGSRRPAVSSSAASPNTAKAVSGSA
jgi:uncharacterized protein (TIGR02271 family)